MHTGIPFNRYISCAFMIWPASFWSTPACKAPYDPFQQVHILMVEMLFAGASSRRNWDRWRELWHVPPGGLCSYGSMLGRLLKRPWALPGFGPPHAMTRRIFSNRFVRAAWTWVPNRVLLQSAFCLDHHRMPGIGKEGNSYIIRRAAWKPPCCFGPPVPATWPTQDG